MKKDINIYAGEMRVEIAGNQLDLYLDDVELSDVIDQFDANDVLEHIGEEKAREYFGIKEEE